ncbi:hypothetical protein FS837_012335 [Tulasnella sp. UAMH 9824]|nr:hypothetical protein FS837_012335 [Tulasnella sp. UAMH 9824]
MTVSASPAFDVFSLVTCEDVKAHLELLRAFHDIRATSTDDDTWQRRVTNSVVKFQTWARQVQPIENPSIPVDMDILMVWHTYLLNPVKYQHDVAQLYPALLQLEFADVVARLARGSLTPPAGSKPGEAAALSKLPVTAELSDLEAAVKRQASFIDKVARLGWGEKATDEFLINCIHRYGCFLDLMKTGAVHSLVPTLDIDLAWHTHQLKGSRYWLDSELHILQSARLQLLEIFKTLMGPPLAGVDAMENVGSVAVASQRHCLAQLAVVEDAMASVVLVVHTLSLVMSISGPGRENLRMWTIWVGSLQADFPE